MGAKYVAQMHTLDGVIEETLKTYPNGNLPDEQKLKILKSVPIYAAFQIGREGAEKEHYQFRIASDAPRNKDNQATPKELEVIQKFKNDESLDEVAYQSEDEKFLSVVSPVRIKESHNCLTCHGNPTKSPWGNGKDILGYQMENMKDGDLRATFAVVSSLAPAQAKIEASTKEIMIYGIISTMLLLLLTFFFLRPTLVNLGAIASRVGKSNEEINRAADGLAAASQELASSNQEQASSVEEVSSSLEEITGMVASAVKNSQESVQLSEQVSRLVQDGSHSMEELQDSVQKIAEANTRVEALAKLIEEIGEKTELIDEIVFQTRLLSFNASVEAERAGEHGRGFAVVAQEVGNLAQMSGKSASEISQIVKSSIKEAQDVVQLSKSRVEAGVHLCKKTSEQLVEISEASKKILSGAEQNLRASEEQNTGIQQINQSINLINRATQENASSAEECSGSSQSLMGQGQNLTEVVGELEEIVHGKKLQVASPKLHQENEKKMNGKIANGKSNVSSIAHKMENYQMRGVGHAVPNGNLALKDLEDPWEKL